MRDVKKSILSKWSLTGRTALITGAGQGIGAAIAIAFAEAGANVVLTGIDLTAPDNSGVLLEKVAARVRARGASALCVVGDMRRRSDVLRMLEQAMQFGPVHVLVNNVGGTTLTATLDLSYDQWCAGIEENVTTTFLGCRIIGEHMAKRSGGAIVNISSMDGRLPAVHRAAYGAGKAAVISLTQTASHELAPFGIRVNGIAPTWVVTDRMRARWDRFPEKERRAVSTIPLGRGATPEEVASLALFLASDASSYITGETLNITGGALVTATPDMIV